MIIIIIFIVWLVSLLLFLPSLGLFIYSENKRRKKIGKILVIITLIAGISLFYYLYGRDLSSSQKVDISPIYNALPPSDIDHLENYFPDYNRNIIDGEDSTGLHNEEGIVTMLNKFYYINDSNEWSSIAVNIYVFDSIANADKHFYNLTLNRTEINKLQFDGTSTNRYGISNVEQIRSPGAFYLPGYFDSFVVFQMGKMLIHIQENYYNKEYSQKYQVIYEISNSLSTINN